MKLTHLALKRLDIPFKTSFKHSSAARSQTESVIAIAESDNGRTGYGEGCPRHYVTGETIETAFEFFEDHRQTLIAIAGLDHLKKWMRQHKLALDKNPAAWCAVELALLDLLGKEQGKPVEAVLSLPEIAGPFYYTAVLGVASFQAFKKQYETYCNMGFTDFKIKVSGNLQEDKEKISLFNADSNSSRRVRLDANNLWENADEAIEVIRKMDYPFFAVEEPLSAEDYDGCLKLYNALNIPVILDESFKRIEQFESIRKNPEAWIINVRISKMGGLLRSLAIMENAEKAHISLIVGAQVGETSILTRAALAAANPFRGSILAQEGAFGTHLLEKDIADPPLMFGEHGILTPSSQLKSPGLGLDIIMPDESFRDIDN